MNNVVFVKKARQSKDEAQYKVTSGICSWCGSEVDAKELVKAHASDDCMELAREPFKGSTPVNLCKRCAE